MLNRLLGAALTAAIVVTSATAASPCLRVMPTVELVGRSHLVVRAWVKDTDKSKFGETRRIATLVVQDVLSGDSKLVDTTIHVGSDSRVACARESFEKKSEVLVFLERDGGMYRVVNFQYGVFRVEEGRVVAWRSADGSLAHRNLGEVRQEVEALRDVAANQPAFVTGVSEESTVDNAAMPGNVAPAPGKPAPAGPTGKPKKQVIYNRP